MPSCVAFVPLRLNSQRVPGKNLADLGGVPLLRWIFERLVALDGVDRVVAYCSSDAIQPHLPEGVELLARPERLDSHTTIGMDIYRAFAEQVPADVYLLAHATSPFVGVATLQEAVDAVRGGGHDSACTVRSERTFAWFRGAPLNYSLDAVVRTQELDPVLLETSACFVYTAEVLARGRRIGDTPHFVEMDPIEAVDIDLPKDLAFARALAAAEIVALEPALRR